MVHQRGGAEIMTAQHVHQQGQPINTNISELLRLRLVVILYLSGDYVSSALRNAAHAAISDACLNKMLVSFVVCNDRPSCFER